MLIERARHALPSEPALSRAWAGAACEVLRRPLGSNVGKLERELSTLAAERLRSQEARALAYRGNAKRLTDDLAGAEEDMQAAGAVIRHGGVTDLAVCAEVHGLAASLRRAQRRFEEALSFIDSALTLFRVSGQRRSAIRTNIKASTIHQARGDLNQALETTLEARSELQALGAAVTEDRLDLLLRHNEIDFLADLERFEEAVERLDQARPLYENFPEPWTQLRLLWVSGKIARGLGRAAEAERDLAAAREGFLAAGAGYDAALVSLELALLHLEEGRTAPVRALAAETVEAFRALGVRREALAAMRLFHLATLREEASQDLARRLLRYFARARFSPGLALRDVG